MSGELAEGIIALSQRQGRGGRAGGRGGFMSLAIVVGRFNFIHRSAE